MKQIFCNRNRSVFIKIFATQGDLERELYGIKVFSDIVITPKVRVLDTRVAMISRLDGLLGYQLEEGVLNGLIASMIIDKRAVDYPQKFNILDELKQLNFCLGQKFDEEIEEIEVLCKGRQLFPIHGDIQKQNILIPGGKLGLIDFEHFTFAPKELELCNSLFFDDGNCLDVVQITKLLPKNYFDPKLMKGMLKFYLLKQLSLGMKEELAKERLEVALGKLQTLFKAKPKDKMNIGDTTSIGCRYL